MAEGGILSPLSARKDSITELAFETIRDAIVNKQLPPGQLLSERFLASQLAVSKTPVREALLRLQHMGLVEQTGRGMRITPSSEQRMLDAYEVRAGLETYTARLAADRGTDEEIQEIAATAAATERPRDAATGSTRLFPGFYSPDRDFHMLIARVARNPQFERLVEEAFTVCWVLRQRDVEEIGFPAEFGDQHAQIAEAITSRDSQKAASKMLEHILFVRERFVSHYRSR